MTKPWNPILGFADLGSPKINKNHYSCLNQKYLYIYISMVYIYGISIYIYLWNIYISIYIYGISISLYIYGISIYLYIYPDCSYFFNAGCSIGNIRNHRLNKARKNTGLPEVRMTSAPASRAQRAALGRRWALQFSLPAQTEPAMALTGTNILSKPQKYRNISEYVQLK